MRCLARGWGVGPPLSLGISGLTVLTWKSEGSGEGIYSEGVGHAGQGSREERVSCWVFGCLLQGHFLSHNLLLPVRPGIIQWNRMFSSPRILEVKTKVKKTIVFQHNDRKSLQNNTVKCFA